MPLDIPSRSEAQAENKRMSTAGYGIAAAVGAGIPFDYAVSGPDQTLSAGRAKVMCHMAFGADQAGCVSSTRSMRRSGTSQIRATVTYSAPAIH